MTATTTEIEGASIVLRGSFNPPILHPLWLAKNGCIAEAEAKLAVESDQFVVSSPLATFSADWLNLLVTKDRFSADTVDPSCHNTLCDFVTSVFRLLEYTPTERMGINRTMHIRLRDEGSWPALMAKLVPKEPWTGVTTEPSLNSLSVGCPRSDNLDGSINIRVESSTRVPSSIFIEVNHDLTAPGEGAVEYFVDVISNHFDSMMKEAEEIANALILLQE